MSAHEALLKGKGLQALKVVMVFQSFGVRHVNFSRFDDEDEDFNVSEFFTILSNDLRSDYVSL